MSTHEIKYGTFLYQFIHFFINTVWQSQHSLSTVLKETFNWTSCLIASQVFLQFSSAWNTANPIRSKISWRHMTHRLQRKVDRFDCLYSNWLVRNLNVALLAHLFPEKYLLKNSHSSCIYLFVRLSVFPPRFFFYLIQVYNVFYWEHPHNKIRIIQVSITSNWAS